MRYRFNALLGTVLSMQAASAVAAALPPAPTIDPSIDPAFDPTFGASVHRVVLVDTAIGVDSLSSPLQTSTNADSTPLSMHAPPATADVMNLPPQPIPTPPAFAMGLSVIMGYAGYQTARRLRVA